MLQRREIVIWFAILASVAMYYVVMRIVPAPGAADNPTLVTALTGAAAVAVAVSFVVRPLISTRSGSFPGLLVALVVCESAALLGLIAWLLTASPRAWYPLAIGAAGVMLHYPARER